MKAWQAKSVPLMEQFAQGDRPKELVASLAESILADFQGVALVDAYSIYQGLMDFWAETMQDDFYQISADGWKAELVWEEQGKKKKLVWHCDLLPKEYITGRYFKKEEAEILELDEKHTAAVQEMDSLVEENSGEDGIFSELDAVKKAPVKALLKEIKGDKDRKEEADILSKWLTLEESIATLKKQIKEAEKDLDDKAVAKYPELSEDEVEELSSRVAEHLKRMGLEWN